MAFNNKTSVTASQNDIHRRILTELLRSEGNRRCADCLSRGPTWASVNLGVFVCLNCSGIHRSLGVHNSKVRSTNLDTWLPEQVAFVQAMGNVRGNTFWEASLPRDFHRPADGDMTNLRTFINDKYVNKRWASKAYGNIEPPTIETYQNHPFFIQQQQRQQRQSSNNAPAVATAPAAPTPQPKPPAPEFDLLSLGDPVGNGARTSAPPAPPAPSTATTASAWDPFVSSAAATTTTTTTAPAVQQTKPVFAASQVDPLDMFAEIDRSTTSRPPSSLDGGAAAVTPEALPASTTTATTTVSDPFSASLLPSSTPAQVAPPSAMPLPLPPRPAVAATANAPPPPQNTMNHMRSASVGGGGVNSGLTPMRAASSNGFNGSGGIASGHSRGKLSNEDILAMFDLPLKK